MPLECEIDQLNRPVQTVARRSATCFLPWDFDGFWGLLNPFRGCDGCDHVSDCLGTCRDHVLVIQV